MTKHIQPGEEVLNRVKRACAKIKALQGEGFTPSEVSRRATHEGFVSVRAYPALLGHPADLLNGFVAFEVIATLVVTGDGYHCRVLYYLPAKNFKREPQLVTHDRG